MAAGYKPLVLISSYRFTRSKAPHWVLVTGCGPIGSLCVLAARWAGAAEVVATSLLKVSAGFTRVWPSVATVIGYAVAFWCLSLVLRTLPSGVVYAVWSGVGIVLIATVAWVFQDQSLDTPAMIGMALWMLAA